ncbi:uncharacterized protein [Battus philenor]|uniref:uncharacterized protein n=1 Tax=Battus philenor TaxID=42288 RepID=UPI0035D0308C
MKSVIIISFLLLTIARVSICLRVVGISVPSLKQRGESVTMTCDYDLEGGRLYSVKWYRDNEEFYRYMPRLRPPQHAHRLDGVKVDLEKSSARRVHLRDLTLKSRGLFRCEVSEEAPSFHSAQSEAFMEVYYFPRDNPRISGHEQIYNIEEPLDVNCSSAKAFPAPELQWYVDGDKITDRAMLIAYGAKPVSQGLLVSTLGLKTPAKPKMRITCIASIGNHKRERSVIIETSSSTQRKAINSIIIFTIIITITNPNPPDEPTTSSREVDNDDDDDDDGGGGIGGGGDDDDDDDYKRPTELVMNSSQIRAYLEPL